MTNSHFLLELAYLRQQEMLQQAEDTRLYRLWQGNQAGLLKQAGHHLLAALRQLEVYFQSNPITPILDRK